MVHACVDIGSNTTRLLVAEIDDEGVRREGVILTGVGAAGPVG